MQTVSDTDVELQAVNVDGSATHAFQTTEFLEVDLRELLLGDDLVSRTDGSLDHTASGTEDDTSTGGFAERAVERDGLEGVEVDVGHLDEACQLTGGDGVIDIGIAVDFELVAAAFVFLGQAGHHRNADHILAFAVDLLSEV